LQGGDSNSRGNGFLGKKEDRAITGLIILGFFGFILSGTTNGAVAGAIAGAAIGYLWDRK